MTRSSQLALILLFPLAIFVGMIVIDRTYGLPGRGQDYVLQIQLPPVDGAIGLPKIDGPPDAGRPLVVIDPGHGGHDPGASKGGIVEKQVTMRIAEAIKARLLIEGGIRVALTRDQDRYLMLAERSSIARKLGADLFISIHADSAENDVARGASVYVLSDKGSSEAAARIAASQNSSDSINGVELSQSNDAVSAILLDLSQRDAQAGSEEMARLLLRETRDELLLHNGRVQSAAFAVLKAPDVASVLFETGYLSNSEDAAWLASARGRETIARATARAIRIFFARQSEV